MYRTLTLSGGAPLSIMCLCLQSRKDVSCSLIALSIPCRKKFSCVKIYFPCLPGTIMHSLVLQSNCDVERTTKIDGMGPFNKVRI